MKNIEIKKIKLKDVELVIKDVGGTLTSTIILVAELINNSNDPAKVERLAAKFITTQYKQIKTLTLKYTNLTEAQYLDLDIPELLDIGTEFLKINKLEFLLNILSKKNSLVDCEASQSSTNLKTTNQPIRL